ncbi:MAG: polyhydroxybutyrate depolymerase [Pseudohongiellaceae bacterium]|jgi:polyhydroxybutyrate depolymerase
MGLLLLSLATVTQAEGSDISTQRETIVHKGITRIVQIRIPARIKPNKKVPLVLVLHGGGGNAAHAEKMTGFTQKAAQENFIVVYPQGTGWFKRNFLTWNAGNCCGQAMKKHIDDVGFISVVIDKMISEFPIDPKRVYVTGMSNGGMMAHTLGIALSEKITAIAPVVATLFGDEVAPPNPVSAIVVNGMLDNIIPYKGGPPNARVKGAWGDLPTQPSLAQATFWAKANGCHKIPNNKTPNQFIHSSYDCPKGRSVEMYSVKDNGHAWPGGKKGTLRGDNPSVELDATDVIWAFFKRHSQ